MPPHPLHRLGPGILGALCMAKIFLTGLQLEFGVSLTWCQNSRDKSGGCQSHGWGAGGGGEGEGGWGGNGNQFDVTVGLSAGL